MALSRKLDYGCVTLPKGWAKLMLEWDNRTEGSLEGPKATNAALGFSGDLEIWRGLCKCLLSREFTL